MESIGYALWLLPAPPEDAALASVIEGLAGDMGGPVFEPHVTLLGRVERGEGELLDFCRDLAARLRPMSVRTRGVEHRDVWNQTLFLRLEDDPGLERLHREAAMAMGMAAGPFLPHLSLAYGDFSAAERETMESSLPPLPEAFALDRLALARTAGHPSAWSTAGVWPLG